MLGVFGLIVLTKLLQICDFSRFELDNADQWIGAFLLRWSKSNTAEASPCSDEIKLLLSRPGIIGLIVFIAGSALPMKEAPSTEY